MKNFIAALVVCAALATASFDADAAKRFGSGMNLGRPAPTFSQKAPAAPAAAPAAQQHPQTGAQQPAARPNAATPPVQKPSMMRSILGGIAAALGITALLSMLGLGGAGLTSLITGLLLAVVVFFVVRMIFARRRPQTASAAGGPTADAYQQRAPEPQQPMANQSAEPSTPAWQQAPQQSVRAGSLMDQLMGGAVPQPAAANASGAEPVDVTPADFDRAGFLKAARENYIKLQKAWDTGNVIEISDFTDNDLFTAVTHQFRERKGEVYHTEVEKLDDELLGIARDGGDYFASVRFTGRLVINGEAEDLDETWILRKPVEGDAGWLLCGIRQNGPAA